MATLCAILQPEFLTLAERQRTTAPPYDWTSHDGYFVASTGEVVDGRAHFDHAISLYDPDAHRPLATRFSIDSGCLRWSFVR